MSPRAFFLGAALVVLLGAAGCDTLPFVADDLPGEWLRQDNRATYRLTLGVGAFSLTSDPPGSETSGLYTLDGNEALFTDVRCRNGMDDFPGRYRLEIEGDTLRIGALDDDCASRRAAFTGTWTVPGIR